MSETAAATETVATKEEPMATTAKKAKPTAKSTAKAPTAKSTKTTKATPKKAAKPKPPRPPKEDLVVFACRVSEPERVAFHKATGPAGASRFARKLMVVFSNEDEGGFRALLREARESRS